MSCSTWQKVVFCQLCLLLVTGCGEVNGRYPVGGVVPAEWGASESAPNEDQPAPAETDEGLRVADRPDPQTPKRNAKQPERLQPGRTLPPRSEPRRADRRRLGDPLPSETEPWGKDRPKPSDTLPSKTERWGKDRRMPSDSMPSNSMPSNSMPSKSMPSKSMPSKSFSRPPLPSETQDE